MRVTAQPAGATVKVDGTIVGPAPWTDANLLCGEHLVVVEFPDHNTEVRRISILAGETIPLDFVLTRAQFGTLVLDVMPLDAMVTLDGQQLGAGPRTVERVPAGPHAIEATHAQYTRSSTSVDLPADATARVTLHLNAKSSGSSSSKKPPPSNTTTTTAPPPSTTGTATSAPSSTLPANTAPATTSTPTQSTTTIPVKQRPPPGPGARIAGNASLTVAGLGAGAAAAIFYMTAVQAYDEFLTVPSDEVADFIYENEVEPNRMWAIALGAGSVALLGTSGVLWATTDFSGGGSVGVTGTF
jgi:hypothetical protein